MCDIKRYIYDLPGYAKELHSYLKLYHLPNDHPVKDAIMIAEMERLLQNLIESIINTGTNKIVPKINMDEETAYGIYGERCQVDPKKLEAILEETILLDVLLSEISKLITDNPWHYFIIKRMMLEDFGDWRIMEWEKEHLDERGNYVSQKGDSESIATFGPI